MLIYKDRKPKLQKWKSRGKTLKNYLKKPIKNSLLEFEKDFIELKDIELKDTEAKIKRDRKTILYTNHFLYRWYG